MQYKKILFILNILLLSFFVSKVSNAVEEQDYLEEIYVGDANAPVEIIDYSSLSCPHCANFHLNIYPKIKEKYVDTGKVKFIFRDFPLNLAALNASKLLRCVEKNQRLLLMNKIYEKQNVWTVGTTIEEINSKLYKILQEFNLSKNDFEKCLSNNEIEEKILNVRIEGQKKYDIDSTPFILINKKKLNGVISLKNIEKVLKKII